MQKQNAFLFPWNPVKFPWTSEELDEDIKQIKKKGKVTEDWRCVSHKKAKVGDRAFLVMVGAKGTRHIWVRVY